MSTQQVVIFNYINLRDYRNLMIVAASPMKLCRSQLSTNITIQVEIIRGPLESDWVVAQDGAKPGQHNYIFQNLNSNRLALDANKTILSLRNNTQVTAAAATAPASPANIKTEATGTATASALTVGTRATATL